jgi:putative endonuclease
MKKYNREKGTSGEEMAASYLTKKGYKILEKNFSTKFGEIDLVCESPSTSSGRATLVFVEVKLKVGDRFGKPEDMINKHKIWQVSRMGELYIMKNKINMPVRVDMVAVVIDREGNLERIDHYENMTQEFS